MKLFLLCILLSIIACNQKVTAIYKNEAVIVSNDTCIEINKDYCLLLHQQKEENRGIVFSKPRLKSKDKIVNLPIYINSTKLNELTFSTSPNMKHMVMCYNAEDGYVYLNDEDSFYHEVHKCAMIAFKDGSLIKDELSPEESTGNWSKNNIWSSQSGEILIDPSKGDTK